MNNCCCQKSWCCANDNYVTPQHHTNSDFYCIQQEIKELRKQEDSINRKLRSQEGQISSLASQVASLTTANTNLTNQLQLADDAILLLTTDLTALALVVEELQQQVEDLTPEPSPTPTPPVTYTICFPNQADNGITCQATPNGADIPTTCNYDATTQTVTSCGANWQCSLNTTTNTYNCTYTA